MSNHVWRCSPVYTDTAGILLNCLSQESGQKEMYHLVCHIYNRTSCLETTVANWTHYIFNKRDSYACLHHDQALGGLLEDTCDNDTI